MFQGRNEEAAAIENGIATLAPAANGGGRAAARSLTTLLVARSAVLVRLNRPQDALATAREAVAAGRQAAGGVGPVRSVELSTAVRNLVKLLRANGLADEAAAVQAEAEP
jgi:hypothetical protein